MHKLTTILDWIRYCNSQMSRPDVEQSLIFGHGSSTAFDEAHALVLGLLHLPFSTGTDYFQATLTDKEIERIKTGLQQRISDHKPVPYITNRTLFMGLEFYVDERVLIPRSPIMELIDQQFQPYAQQPIHSLLDLCCGSGCIGIASAYMLPHADVVVSDIDEDALAVANLNIVKHDIEDQVITVASDVFEHLSERRFDVIVSNPPYVDADTIANLPAEFQHEPSIGLASGHDGLDVTRRILRQAFHHLHQGGLLIVEVGASWPLLEAAYPDISFHWHTFEHGGEGVFVMTYDELAEYQTLLAVE